MWPVSRKERTMEKCLVGISPHVVQIAGLIPGVPGFATRNGYASVASDKAMVAWSSARRRSIYRTELGILVSF